MNDAEIVEKTIAYVRKELDKAEGGHDWFHIQRVFRNTLLIAKEEEVDLLTVSLAALLHDIADAKFHGGDEEIGPRKAEKFLKKIDVPREVRDHVLKIIRNVSYKNSLEKKGEKFNSPELQVVQDADRLDAIGAIGIGRAFSYGGYAGRKLYDPDIPPKPQLNKAEYKINSGPNIIHFYEKLLLLRDLMHTKTGRRLAEHRHQFMLDFLEEFFEEWRGSA